VAEVGEATGYSRPAATRLLDSLAGSEIVVKDPRSKRYYLTLRLYEWVNLAAQGRTPVNVARKEIIRLAAETGRECNLLMLDGLDVVFLERCDIIDGQAVNRPVAGRRAWYQTASGIAIAAFSAPDATKALLDQTSRRPHEGFDRKATEGEIARAQDRGYAISNWAVRPSGVLGIGVAILGQMNTAAAALGTFIEPEEVEQDSTNVLLRQITSTAARISHYLGHEAVP
jgi:DNA-binding IclR family transcriptional regulator